MAVLDLTEKQQELLESIRKQQELLDSIRKEYPKLFDFLISTGTDSLVKEKLRSIDSLITMRDALDSVKSNSTNSLDKVFIKVSLVNGQIVLKNMTQIAIDPNNGSLGLNLAGDAVVNPGGRVIWDVDPSANVTWINILPKKSQEDVWDSDTLHGNSGGWTGKIKNKNDLQQNVDIDWEYSLYYKLENDPETYVIDPIIRVNK